MSAQLDSSAFGGYPSAGTPFAKHHGHRLSSQGALQVGRDRPGLD